MLDDKLANTIKLISLKNAIDFNNNIKSDVVISKTFSYTKDSKINIKDIIPEIKQIISELSLLSIDEKKKLYDKIIQSNTHYLNDLHASTNKPILSDDRVNENSASEKKPSDSQYHELPQL